MDYQTILNNLDNEINVKREEDKMPQSEVLELYKNKHGEYWYCKVVDTWVHIDIRSIPSIDRVNKYVLFKLSSVDIEQSYDITLLGVTTDTSPYTISEYHDKFCSKDEENDRWIFTPLNS